MELLAESREWQPHTPSLPTPGFRLYLFSLLLCQHHHLFANAQARGSPLQQVEGTFTVVKSAVWILEQLRGDFFLKLVPNSSREERPRADADAIASIKERRKLCPGSRNLPPSVAKRIELAPAR